MEEHNTGFVCLKQQFDSTSASGRVLFKICLVLAEFERELTSERTSENIFAKAKRGLRNGGQILDYDSDPAKPGYLIPNESEKILVNLIFDKYLELGSIKRVADFLNKAGYRTKGYTAKNSKRVHKPQKSGNTSVQYILTNLLYIGMTEVNRNNKTQDQNSLSENKRYFTLKAVWEGIVPEQKFMEAQALMRNNGQTKKNATAKVVHNFLLRRLVECDHCGSTLEGGSGTSQNDKLHFYYRHINGTKRSGCKVSS